MTGNLRLLRRTKSHDYAYLTRRWRRVAKSAGLLMEKFGHSGGCDLFFLQSRNWKEDRPSLYFSAGIHGDEPAATEALVEWAATESRGLLREANVLIFPCLNPWGLVQNSRHDAGGRDLNRTYHHDKVRQTAAHRRRLSGRRFDLALTLHEDYDATGFYLYEISGPRPPWGEILIQAAARHVPVEQRRQVDGRRCNGGVIRRAIDPALMPEHPEAFLLHFEHARRTFTFESPSEYFLDDRVQAHVAVLKEVTALALSSPS